MSDQPTREKSGKRTRSTASARRMNRAQQRAMQVRAHESAASQGDSAPSSDESAKAPSHRSGTRDRPARQPERVIALSKERELAIIRSDLRRMLLVAGSLLAGMLVLLIIVA